MVSILDPVDATITASTIYDPFGEVHGSIGDQSALGFQADYTDPDTGDVWMGARWYTPSTSSFRSRDTVFGELQTPMSLNRYTYAWANPIAYWDHDGHCPPPLRDARNQCSGLENTFHHATNRWVTPAKVRRYNNNYYNSGREQAERATTEMTIAAATPDSADEALEQELSRIEQLPVCFPFCESDGAAFASGEVTARPGWGGVQINLFIPDAERCTLGLACLHGDDRGFETWAGLGDSRAVLYIDFETGQVTGAYSESCANGHWGMRLGGRNCNHAYDTTIVVQAAPGPDCRTITRPQVRETCVSPGYDAHVPGRNGFRIYDESDRIVIGVEGEVSAGPPGSPSINGVVELTFEAGIIEAQKSGDRFPAYEIYWDLPGHDRREVDTFAATNPLRLFDWIS